MFVVFLKGERVVNRVKCLALAAVVILGTFAVPAHAVVIRGTFVGEVYAQYNAVVYRSYTVKGLAKNYNSFVELGHNASPFTGTFSGFAKIYLGVPLKTIIGTYSGRFTAPVNNRQSFSGEIRYADGTKQIFTGTLARRLIGPLVPSGVSGILLPGRLFETITFSL